MNIKAEAVVKPVVHFRAWARWDEYADGRGATLRGVLDHPRLGYEPVVYTSEVLSTDSETDPTLIETRNTIYKKVPSA